MPNKRRKKKVIISNGIDDSPMFTVWSNLSAKDFAIGLLDRDALRYLYQCDNKPIVIADIEAYLEHRYHDSSSKIRYQVLVDIWVNHQSDSQIRDVLREW